jgi:hypothetical protein
MDLPSESYRLFPRLFHTDLHFLLKTSVFIEEDINSPGLSGESLSYFVRLYHTYHFPCRRFTIRQESDREDEPASGSFERVP